LLIQVPGVRQETLDRIKALRRDLLYRNGRFISGIPAMLRELGVEHVSVDAFPLLLDDPANAFGLSTWARSPRLNPALTTEELDEWDRAVEAAQQQRSLIYLVT